MILLDEWVGIEVLVRLFWEFVCEVDACVMGDGRVVSAKGHSAVDQREPADRFIRQRFVA